MAINKNINDDITLAYLLKKVKTDVLSVLNAAVEKIYVALGNKVDKTGDTMTGMLYQKSADLDIAQTQSVWGSAYHSLTDKNDNRVGVVRAYQQNGFDGIHISGHNEGNENALRLGVKSDGSRNVFVTDPAAWRTALNAVNKSGDTMSGILYIDANIIRRNNNLDVGSNPSTVQYDDIHFCGKNSIVVGLVRAQQNTDGTILTTLGARRPISGNNITNEVRLSVSPTGVKQVTVTDPDAWREALGLGTNGAFPITVAQGGSGQTGITTTTTASSIITAASGITIINASYARWGKVAQIYVRWKSANTVSVTADGNATNVTVGTIVSGKRPAINSAGESFGDGAGPAFYYLETGGSLKLCACGGTGASRTIAAGAEFYCCATYLLP